MGKVIGALTLVLSIGLFLIPLYLPAARIEGVQPGVPPSSSGTSAPGSSSGRHTCSASWAGSASPAASRWELQSTGPVPYGPLYWLWGFAGEFQTRSFPSGWAWLASVLLLVLGSVSLWSLDDRRKQRGETRTDGTGE